MKERRLVMIVGIILFLGGWVELGLAAELKIGFVDIQKAVNDCNAGKEAKKAITKDVEKYQRQFTEKQRELQTMKENLDKQAPMLNPEARSTKEKELQLKIREFQRWQEDNQNEINQRRIEVERNLQLGLQRVVKKLGEDEGYTLVLEKNENIVLYASKAIDLTDRVIKIFDVQKK